MKNSDDESSSLLEESICMERGIYKANYEDLREILQLQYLSYQSKADLFGSGANNLVTQNANNPIDLDYNICIIDTEPHKTKLFMDEVRSTYLEKKNLYL